MSTKTRAFGYHSSKAISFFWNAVKEGVTIIQIATDQYMFGICIFENSVTLTYALYSPI